MLPIRQSDALRSLSFGVLNLGRFLNKLFDIFRFSSYEYNSLAKPSMSIILHEQTSRSLSFGVFNMGRDDSVFPVKERISSDGNYSF
jgi:hypothetical protein